MTSCCSAQSCRWHGPVADVLGREDLEDRPAGTKAGSAVDSRPPSSHVSAVVRRMPSLTFPSPPLPFPSPSPSPPSREDGGRSARFRRGRRERRIAQFAITDDRFSPLIRRNGQRARARARTPATTVGRKSVASESRRELYQSVIALARRQASLYRADSISRRGARGLTRLRFALHYFHIISHPRNRNRFEVPATTATGAGPGHMAGSPLGEAQRQRQRDSGPTNGMAATFMPLSAFRPTSLVSPSVHLSVIKLHPHK